MPFSSGAFGQLRYVVESVIGTTPASAGINLRQTGPTMKAAVATTASKEIQPSRMVSSLARTDLNIDGGFKFELSGKEYDPFLEGMLGSSFVHYGTLGLATIANPLTTTSGTIVSTAIPTANLGLGQWFKLVPPTAASQAVKDYFADAWFKTHAATAVTATTITLDASTPIVAPGIVTSLGTSFGISSSVASNGANKRGFTLEWNLTDITQFLPFKGMQTNTLNLDVQVGNIVTGEFGFLGQGHSGMVAATAFTGGPTASQTLDVMNAVSDIGVFQENGVNLLSAGSFIKSVKLSLTNNLRAQKAVAVFGNAGVGFGELNITGTLEVYVSDAVYYNKWFAGTNTSLAIGFADALGNGYLIELDKVTFKDGSFNPGDLSSDAMLSLPFQALYNATTSRGIRITRAIAA